MDFSKIEQAQTQPREGGGVQSVSNPAALQLVCDPDVIPSNQGSRLYQIAAGTMSGIFHLGRTLVDFQPTRIPFAIGGDVSHN